MSDERTRYNEFIRGLRKITVEYEEMLTFVSNSSGNEKFKGVAFETSRRAKNIQGTQGKGTNPVVVINGECYIEISEQDFNEAKRVSSALPIQVAENHGREDSKKTTLDKAPEPNLTFPGVVKGAKVKHKSFGVGVITSLSKDIIIVTFKRGETKFQFPDAFVKEYLSLDKNQNDEGGC